jgi:hypothetical protein
MEKNMVKISIIILFFFPFPGLSQLHINKTKSMVKEEIEKVYMRKDNITTTITETDTTLILKVRGTGTTEADRIYSFDKSGKCNSEKTVTWCDTCHTKLMQPVLAAKKYMWKQINQNQYISKFSAGVFLEWQERDDTWSFTIFRFNLNKKMYDLLLNKN